ncbi:hypothetical protein [Streptomyces sp. NBC_00102]|uniref:hypothetical protein n=1 Tax=Streptomyces sp. NBC_00102 TaxID=2975652 RepID=UPI002255E499|nr:hypothetical protein [Streptomyces sp. NBC_00102]MCX5395598.1 hypothetical protein [Streptomyces sp. NBC_00102]
MVSSAEGVLDGDDEAADGVLEDVAETADLTASPAQFDAPEQLLVVDVQAARTATVGRVMAKQRIMVITGFAWSTNSAQQVH